MEMFAVALQRPAVLEMATSFFVPCEKLNILI